MGQPDGALMVDVISARGIQIAQGVIGQRRQMDDRIESAKLVGGHVPDIRGDSGHTRRVCPERAIGKETIIETDDVVPGGLKQGRQDGADVSLVSRNENSHASTFGLVDQRRMTSFFES
jgi:hypothetical protein